MQDTASDDTDTTLIRKLAAGDRTAFATLLSRHLPVIHRLGWRLLGEPTEAEDVAQEAFLKLWNFAPDWRDEGASPRTWLYRVAFNLCQDRLRRRRVVFVETVPEVPTDPSDAPGAAMMEAERNARVKGALDALPERQRAALVLSYYEGLSQAEAAAIMEIGEEALESLLARGRRKLRELLAADGRELLGEMT
ncbi:MAG: RNA polymerase sigma factor [Alphaproteobacteria bacterium]|nr:RNA polymerase sigma factor [Alphaproteobacteria bacterium]MBU0797310.1 RNA polymerase sigma factor [Alphaproteobacteria bacterium]MBU0888902.1 RNA polymerase sigma factor [Alphaproteobacteria bacterium]MBU1813922.1 RNA polymerase sigma factor [Alphaproteobacteria bacterium]